jgi:hypothetical protein
MIVALEDEAVLMTNCTCFNVSTSSRGCQARKRVGEESALIGRSLIGHADP